MQIMSNGLVHILMLKVSPILLPLNDVVVRLHVHELAEKLLVLLENNPILSPPLASLGLLDQLKRIFPGTVKRDTVLLLRRSARARGSLIYWRLASVHLMHLLEEDAVFSFDGLAALLVDLDGLGFVELEAFWFSFHNDGYWYLLKL